MHVPTWDSAEADALWTRTCGAERWRGALETVERDMPPPPTLSCGRCAPRARGALVEYARERLTRQVASMSVAPSEAAALRACLDPATLTLGFARRFAVYKRPNLLLHDPERLLRILVADPGAPCSSSSPGRRIRPTRPARR